MRIAFDSRPAKEATGVGRYARCLLGALAQTAPAPDEVIEMRRPGSGARLRGSGVFHAPWLDGALLHSPCPMVVSLHGLGALDRASERLRTGARTRLRALAVQRAVRVIVPTDAVGADAERHLGISPERISVIAQAPDAAMSPRPAADVARVRARLGLPERYLLHVGGLEHPDPAKRIRALAAAPREMPLVLAGPARPWAGELEGAILTGRLEDDDLAAVYTGAHALLLAAESPGFGLAAVEALACGTPVAAFRSATLEQSLGDRATFVEPCDLATLIRAGESSAPRPAPSPPRWSWLDAAAATWEVYAEAAASAHRQRPARAARPQSRRAAPSPGIDGLEAQ